MATNRPSHHGGYDRLRDRVLSTGEAIEIRGHIRGMDDIERIKEWVAFENRNKQRGWVLEALSKQADTVRAERDRDE